MPPVIKTHVHDLQTCIEQTIIIKKPCLEWRLKHQRWEQSRGLSTRLRSLFGKPAILNTLCRIIVSIIVFKDLMK